MYYVYAIQSRKNKTIYIGYANNLRKRFKEHNLGKVFSTKPYKTFSLIYYEAYQNKQDALKREKFLKSGWGKNYIKRVLKHYFHVQNGGLDKSERRCIIAAGHEIENKEKKGEKNEKERIDIVGGGRDCGRGGFSSGWG